MRIIICIGLLLISTWRLHAQNGVSKVWVADKGDGNYKNPIIHADYSDPDVIRVGNDYYLVASSFEDIPGLPILHSNDLVNWRIIAHALRRQPPFDHYSLPQHGNGVWAPSIRYHNGEFFIYYPDPDFGIYLVKSRKAEGPWSEPILVEAGKGLIDPCPLWDDDARPNGSSGRGNVYLVHAYAGSRAGIKSLIVVKKLNKEGTKTMDTGVLVYDGHDLDPTIEGPKFYKRNGYYYIFAPAGGVSTGWQLALRSKNVYGPYERKVVMDQGSTTVNGPHQGAWVTTQTRENWFIHFQDKGAYGRVVHLQPMKWINDWPVIGRDTDGDGKGEPAYDYKKPNVGRTYPITTPQESDEFDEKSLGLQWQWMANPKPTWAFMNLSKGVLRLYAEQIPDSAKNLWDVPNVLLQKFPAEEFAAITKLTLVPNSKLENEKAGLAVMGFSYAYIGLKSKKDGIYLVQATCVNADEGKAENENIITKIKGSTIYPRVEIRAGGKCKFGYSLDGQQFIDLNGEFRAETGRWIGSKLGIFCTREMQTNDSGFADFDLFRVQRVRGE
jgi:beta-xylosidase